MDDRVAGQGGGRDPGQLPRPGRGRPSASRPPATTVMSPSPVTRPMIATGRSQRSQTARTAVPALRPDDRQHPLLGLGDHDLERLHARLAARDRVEIDEDPGSGPVGRLGRRAGDPAGAEVLEALDQPALDQLETRLDEQLLGERVADLDRRPLRRLVGAERRARPGPTRRRSRRARSSSRTAPRGCPGPGADASVSRVSSSSPIAITLTSGLPWYDGSNTSSPPTVGTPTQLP